MMKSFLALFLLLLTFASHGTWCAAAADRSHRITTAHLRPHLHVEELHGKKLMEIQVPRKLGHEVKVPKRMAIAHKGGSAGAAAAAGAGGGGVSESRPRNGKNGAATLPAPATTSILALAITCAAVLSSFSF
ncbi:Os08g0269500 [Oryza sativa Japonica Group]|uniref:Os08g0269500 protein n=4 Tax=Oryza TaxID=4527 RepID=Q0J6T8_ORYSJ|nr:uncharacterized protein LOC4345132 [Oryza sativa Japonica Group]EAZ06301.1 hypothetical protein OsI_28535 [Oryza sativa Indica Group]EAZ42123.1 hypothetical protein OsJ_26682 [Oryza sativa Japonica Group]KAF2918916.1 hypothetical protein DAI22_08g095500 [Oryza sativa Japonica Group]BAF23327.1 Os08g0269500 [Oryza sativa Japonica Group]BAG88428.1 unnamed protein product [Oryza sativa Japonica Group]|eukprot:NP_001061413.1 Os08g0269500 [Oryza sativa Japonica Group]